MLVENAGVFRGHYRTDTRGANLNRYYLNPDPADHPSIYAAKSLILYYHQNYSNKPAADSSLTKGMKSMGLSSSSAYDMPENSLLERHMFPHDNDANEQSLAIDGTKAHPLSAVNLEMKTSLSCSATQLSKSLASDTSSEPIRSSPLENHSCKTIDETAQEKTSCNLIKTSQQSGIALYIDLHAHATKRGVFMYGNHFSNVPEAAENMLFPKLMSLNSPHLDFEHCVFSEKNMYTADKRDGLSKEGSGRVAIHKATGIIPWCV